MLKPSGRTALAINIRMSYHKRTVRTLSHCFYDLKYHLVWTPKYRGKVLGAEKIKRTHGLYEKESLWARGYFVSTIGLDEHLIRRYVRHQHHHNQLDQPSLFDKLL